MTSRVNKKAVGGWLKDADATLDRNYRQLGDHDGPLDPERIAYFEDYRTRYFYGSLLTGQGAENILARLDSHANRPNRWLDLGAGVTSLFWAAGISLADDATVEVCDLVPEALHVLRRFKQGSECPPCYRDALKLFGRDETHISAIRNRDWTFHVFDCLGDAWPSEMAGSQYDLITAIGCFGLCASVENYRSAFNAGASHLSPSGRFIGADWIRSRSFIEEEGHDNAYLNPEMIVGIAHEAGLSPLTIEHVNISDDDYYDSVIVWAFA